MRRRGSSISPANEDNFNSDIYSPEDRKRLRNLLNEISNPTPKIGLSFSPTMRAMMCVEPDQVCDRLLNMLASVNLIHALLLNPLLGAALSPLDVRWLLWPCFPKSILIFLS
jgi:hypothetical protein